MAGFEDERIETENDTMNKDHEKMGRLGKDWLIEKEVDWWIDRLNIYVQINDTLLV